MRSTVGPAVPPCLIAIEQEASERIAPSGAHGTSCCIYRDIPLCARLSAATVTAAQTVRRPQSTDCPAKGRPKPTIHAARLVQVLYGGPRHSAGPDRAMTGKGRMPPNSLWSTSLPFRPVSDLSSLTPTVSQHGPAMTPLSVFESVPAVLEARDILSSRLARNKPCTARICTIEA